MSNVIIKVFSYIQPIKAPMRAKETKHIKHISGPTPMVYRDLDNHFYSIIGSSNNHQALVMTIPSTCSLTSMASSKWHSSIIVLALAWPVECGLNSTLCSRCY